MRAFIVPMVKSRQTSERPIVMSTTVDRELEARVAEQIRILEEQGNDPAHLLEQMHELFRRIHAGRFGRRERHPGGPAYAAVGPLV